MNRSRRWYVLALLAFLSPGLTLIARGQNPPKDNQTSAEKWLLDRALAVSPQSAPTPALKYRLFPHWSELKEGNAVPIYLRLVHEQSDAARRYWTETPEAWNKLPIEQLPLALAHDFLHKQNNFLRQLELGARRRTAEWNYTFDDGDPIGMLLPDMQVQRSYAHMLILQARVAIADRDYKAAVHTIETGFAFSRHLAEGPFFVSQMVAIGVANQFTDCLLDLVERPDGPNLYWALTTLPRPLIGMRHAWELEERVMEMQFPELADLDRQRTPEQWDATLNRFRKDLDRLVARDKHSKVPARQPGMAAPDAAAASPDLPAARMHLVEKRGLSEAAMNAMPPAQILLLYLVDAYKEISDDIYKLTYVPYPHSRPGFLETDRRMKAAPPTEATRLFQALGLEPLLAIKVQLAQIRIERKLAALRVIEALRLYAAAHGGNLPDKLGEVTIVALPNDAGTDKPFEYQRDGQTAILTSRLPSEPLETTGLRYRVTVRK